MAGAVLPEPVGVDPGQAERQDPVHGSGNVVREKPPFESPLFTVPNEILGTIVAVSRLAHAAGVDQVFTALLQANASLKQRRMPDSPAIKSNQLQTVGVADEAKLPIHGSKRPLQLDVRDLK